MIIFSKPVELDVIYYKNCMQEEEVEKVNEANILLGKEPDFELPLEEYATRLVTFYNIDTVAPYFYYWEKGQESYDTAISKVISSGKEYIVNLHPDVVNGIIKQHIK